MTNNYKAAEAMIEYITDNDITPKVMGENFTSRVAKLGMIASLARLRLIDMDTASMELVDTVQDIMEDFVIAMGYKSLNRWTLLQMSNHIGQYMSDNWTKSLMIILKARIMESSEPVKGLEEQTLFDILSQMLLDYMPTAQPHLAEQDLT